MLDRSKYALSLLLAACALALPTFGGTDVLVVDAAGGAGSQFTEIQDAIDVAADGDLVLVRSGTYGPITIDGLSVSVLADEGAAVVVRGPSEWPGIAVDVANVGVGKAVVLRGLDVVGQDLFPVFSVAGIVSVASCAGPVMLQDVEVTSEDFFFSTAMSVGSSPSVVLVDCRLEATSSALNVLSGGVSLYESNLISGNTTASVQLDSEIYASGTRFKAGDGAPTSIFCTHANDGHDCIFMDETSTAILLDNTFLPGSPFPCDFDPGQSGVAVRGGTSTFLSGTSRALSVPSPARDGGTVSALHSGQASVNDLVVAIFSLQLAPTPVLDEANGPLFPSLASLGLATLGVVPPGGTLQTTFPVSFPVAGAFVEVFVQDLFVRPSGTVFASNPASLVYLGPGF